MELDVSSTKPAGVMALVDEAGLDVLRVDLANALEGFRDRLVRTVSETSDATRASLAATTTGVDEAMHTLRETLLDRLEEQHASMRMRLAELTVQSQAGVDANRQTQEKLAELSQNFETVVAAMSAATAQLVETGRRLDAVSAGLLARVEEAAAYPPAHNRQRAWRR